MKIASSRVRRIPSIVLVLALTSLLGGCAAFREPEPVIFLCGNMLFDDPRMDDGEPCTGTRDLALDAPAQPLDGD